MNLCSVLLDTHIAGGRSHRTAVIEDDRHVRYAELQERVRRIAAGIHSAGVGSGDRIVLSLPGVVDLIAAWLATQYVGAIAVTVPPTLRRRELAAIVDDVEPRLAIAAGALPCPTPCTVSPGELDGAAGPAPRPYDHQVDDIAVIAYTTGEDGRAHGACHSAAAILASADSYAGGVLRIRPDDVVGGHPPLFFAYGLGALLVFPLRFGAATAPAPRFDAEAVLGLIARRRVTVFFGTATCYRLLVRSPDLMRRFDLGSLRLCVSAGEPLDAAVSQAWAAATGVDLLDGLGTTELFHIVVSQRPGQVIHGALGRAVAPYELRVEHGGRPAAAGREGHLAVRGPTSCVYWRRPDLQQRRVRDGWTLTGDVVVRDADDVFWFRRRADAIIVSAGYNIAPREVEAVLEEHPAVARAEVGPASDPTRGTIVVARIELRPGAAASAALALDLQQHTQRELSPYKCPRRIEFVTSSGV